MAQRIYINPEDDIQSVIDNVLSGRDSAVEVVVPAGARILQNIVDAYLLRDAALAHKKNVTIVTNDVMGRIFAERAGISVASARESEGEFLVREAAGRMSDIIPARRGGTTPALVRSAAGTRSSPKKPTERKKKQDKGIKGLRESTARRFLQSYRTSRAGEDVFADLRQRRKKNGLTKIFKPTLSKIVGGSLILALIVAGIIFGTVLPRAEVLIYPVREPASFTVEVRVDQGARDTDVGRGIIVGTLFTEERTASEEFSATSLKSVSEKARGTITIFNEFSSSPQVFIPSRFESEDGKIFWTTKNVTVPGAVIEAGKTTPGTVETEVVAAEAGEAYNIGPVRFTMPALKGTERQEKVYARSTAAMSGGRTGEALVVSQQDLDNAYRTLQTKLAPEFQKLRQNLPPDLVLWEEAYNEETVERKATKNVGEPAEKFSVSIRVIARAIAFRKADLDALLENQIISRLSQEQTILPKSKEVTFLKPPVVDYQRGTVTATLAVKVDVIDNIDLNAFRGAVLKKNKQEIKQILPSFEGIERVEVKLWPFWVSRVPKMLDRVTVKIFGI